MKYKRFVDLTDDEIRVIVAFLFDTKKIGNITRDYKNDEIKIREWEIPRFQSWEYVNRRRE